MKSTQDQPLAWWRKALTYSLMSWLVWQPMVPAFAAGVAVAEGNTRVEQAGNGVPVVNIATPNQAGISHNKYNDFNVDQQGLILNNSTGKLTQTQLGGLIQNNPNLVAGKEAQGIINEVVSANSSRLNGYMEVAGKAANVMVANPYGITCNGCGFLNTPNATLTTGKPVLGADGSLRSLDVTQGAITLEGQGLDARQSDAFSLISRAAQINAGLYAKDLKVTVGANHVDAQGNATPIAGAGTAPSLAVDAGALGGMYANRIYLVSSDKGVGVNLGNLNASVGDIQIDASGKLALGKTTSSGRLTANAQEIALQDAQQAGGDMALNSQGKLAVQVSHVTSGGNLTLASGQLTSDAQAQVSAAGNISANAANGGQWQGNLTAGKDLQLNSGDFTNAGVLSAGGSTRLTTQNLSNTGTLLAQSDQTIQSTTFDNSGKVQAKGSQHIQADNLHNNGAINAEGALQLNAKQALTQGTNGNITANSTLDITAGQATLGGKITGQQGTQLRFGSLNTTGDSAISSVGDLSVDADSAQLGGLLSGDHQLSGHFGQLTTVAGSQIQSGADADISARDSAMLWGNLRTGRNLQLGSGSLNSGTGAQIYAVGNIQANAGNNGLWNGSLAAGGDLGLNAANITSNGKLTAGGNAQLTTQKLINGGLIQAQGQQTLTATDLSNTGKLQSGSTQQIRADNLDSQGMIGSQQSLELRVAREMKLGDVGSLFAGDRLNIHAGDMDLNGVISGENGLTLNGDVITTGQNSLLSSLGDIDLNSSDFTHAGLMDAGGNTRLTTQHLVNIGTLQAQGDQTIETSTLDNGGKALAKGTQHIQADGLNNNGAISADGVLQLDVKQGLIQGASGSLAASSALGIRAGQATIGGKITGQHSSQLNIGNLTTNNNAEITSAGDLTVNADSAQLDGLLSGDQQLIGHFGQLTTSAGSQIQSGADTDISATERANLGGNLRAGRNLQLSSGSLNAGRNAQVYAVGNLQASAGNKGQWSGSLTAGGDLGMNAADFINNGTVAAGGDTRFTTQKLTNSGLIQALGQQTLTATEVNNTGKLQSGSAQQIKADLLENQGLIGSQQGLDLQIAHQMTVGGQGSLFAGDQLTIGGGDMTFNGVLTGKNGLTLNSDAVSAGQNSLISSLGDIQLNAAQQALNGRISTTGDIGLTATDLSVGAQGLIHSDKDLSIAASNGATIAGALDSQTLEASGGRLQLNGGGSLAALGDMNLSATQQQLDGTVSAGHHLAITADQLNAARGGKTSALQDVQVNITGGGEWLGSLIAGRDLTFNARDFNNGGTLAANRNGQFGFNRFLNSGLLQSLGKQNLTGDTFNNNGTSQSGGDQALSLNQFNNQGLTGAQGDLGLSVRDGLIAGDASTLLADGKLTLHAAQAELGGTLTGTQGADINATTLISHAGSVQTSQGDVTLNAGTAKLNGFLSADGSMALSTQQLMTGDRSQTQGKNALGISASVQADLDGKLVTPGTLSIQAGTLNNVATLGAGNVEIEAAALNNHGSITADNNLHVQADTLQQLGTLAAQNQLNLEGKTLTNQGSITAGELGINATGSLSNQQPGMISATRGLTISAPTLVNEGTLAAKTVGVNADSINNSGLLQGNGDTTLTADSLTNGAQGQVLSGAILGLHLNDTQNLGRLQGAQLSLTGNGLNNQGTLLGTNGLNAQLQGDLSNSGRVLTSGKATINANRLENSGQLLSDKDATITASHVINQGQIQGDTLAVNAQGADNSGNLIGLKGLTVQLQQDLNNAASGKMLTQGALTVNAGHVTNNGNWQADSADLHASQLDLNGAIQTATRANLILTSAFNTQSQGKVVSTGLAVLQASDLNNQGNWSADNLTLQGGTLSNSGTASGVSALATTLSGQLQVLQSGSLLSGGTSTLNAGNIVNGGNVQANNLIVNTNSLSNSGQLQGQQSLRGAVQNDINNLSGGMLRSQGTLDLDVQSLLNQGQLQGDGVTHLTLTNNLNNQGTLLTGGRMTLSAPTLTNTGVLQAQGLTFTGNTLNNSGTLTGQGDSTLNVDQTNNQGQLQGDWLQMNGSALHNSGTLFSSQMLGLNVQNADNQSGGKLYSAGNLTLVTSSLNPSGSLLALGDMTLQLGSGFTQTGTLAAGQNLNLSTQGDLNILGTLQGSGIQLTSTGNFTNSGQLRGGGGTVGVEAGNITLNGNGSVQSGGDIRLASRGVLNNSGFVGGAGSVVMSAAGQLANSALLYAGNNMQLLADSILNNRGDILAGNSLWMQRDAAGNANSEVVNTSGNIETTDGDITINTGHLLNQRDGLSTSNSYQAAADSPASSGASSIKVRLGDLDNEELGVYLSTFNYNNGGSGSNGERWSITTSYLGPNTKGAVKKFLLGTSTVTAFANSGAGRIAANNNMNIFAGTLDNSGSNLLAGNNIALSGVNLNNHSYENNIQNKYLTYNYTGGLGSDNPKNTDLKTTYKTTSTSNQYTVGRGNNVNSVVTYNLSDAPTFEDISTGEGLRSVIQAGGAVNASFSNNISNTTTTANAGGVSHAISAPVLNGTSGLQPVAGTQGQQLAAGKNLTVGSVQWTDSINSALKQIGNQGAALTDYPLPTSNNGLFVASKDPSSPYLITTNPQLGGVGKTDPSLFNALNEYLARPASAISGVNQQATQNGTGPDFATVGNSGAMPTLSSTSTLAFAKTPVSGATSVTAPVQGSVPVQGRVVDPVVLPGTPTNPRIETAAIYTDASKFIGSSYFMDRLKLTPDYDYKFLGDAAFDTRYVSNAVLSKTGQRYVGGTGSDLQQMQYLIDNAAAQQAGLGLQLGVNLSPEQVAALTKSIVWWEKTTVDGQTVLAPKLYLSANDTHAVTGSVISGNTVNLDAGHIVNAGSTIQADTQLAAKSGSSLDNLNAGLIASNGSLQLSALGDINNIGSSIAGQTVALTSVGGDINNITQAQQWTAAPSTTNGKASQLTFSDTLTGNVASISASQGLSLTAGNNINNTGAKLSAGSDLQLDALNDINIKGNALSSDKTAFSGWNGKNATRTISTDSQGSDITAGGDVDIRAGHDLNLAASSVTAKGDASLIAGNDVNLAAMDKSTHQSTGNSQNDVINATRSSVSSGGNLAISAGRDLNSQAAQLAADLDASLSAGRDVNLDAQQASTYSEKHGSKDQHITETIRQQGTDITSGGSTTIIAGRDISTQAADVKAVGDLALNAVRDINISTAKESDYQYDEETKVKKGFLSKTTTHTVKEDYATTEKGSQLSGDKVSIVAGQDLAVKGSSVVGDGDVTLKAGKDLNITAVTEEQSSYRLNEKKTSGMFSGGGLGVTIGSKSSRQQINQDGTTQSLSGSTVGSTGGNLNLIAGEKAHIGGSDVIASQNLNVVGGSVTVDPGNDMLTRKQVYEQKQSGLTLSISSPVTDLLLSLNGVAEQASQTGDDRMKALYGAQAANLGWAAYMSGAGTQAGQLLDGKIDRNFIQVQANIGSSKSQSTSELEQNQVTGSSLSAGHNVAIVSTGNYGQSGDINISGSGVTGNNVTLAAQNDLRLQAASNNSKQTSNDSSSGWSAGAHMSLGENTGIGVQASGYLSKASSDGETTEYVNTRINAKDGLSLSSGRDTVLSGAQALGDKITANVGRDLTLTSLQDTDNYQSKQQSISGGGSFTFGSMTGSASLSMSQAKINSEYASVGDQSGLFAGNKGYDIYVGEHTQLNGAVIASTAEAANNALSTGSLGWDDIQNKANYSASSVGVSGGFSSSTDDKGRHNAGAVLPVMTNANGSASGTTHSAVADGSIAVRDQGNQKQDLNDLSRDTENANGHIDKIFDKEKIEQNQALAQAISEVGVQTMQNVGQQMQINAQKDALNRLSKTDAYQNASAATQQAMLDKDPQYLAAQKEYGIGSPFWTAGTAISAALAGLAGGDMNQALAGGLAPYLSLAVKKATTDKDNNVNDAGNIAGHALAGAVVAYLQGGSVAGGAAGAAGGELAAKAIMEAYYPGRTVESLSNTEKSNISAISTLAAGLAGGVAGNSTNAAGTGAVSGKVAVENNYLSNKQKTQREEEVADCKDSTACKLQVGSKWDLIDAGQQTSYGAGMLVGVPAGLVDSVQSIVDMGLNPAETYDALKSLFNSGDVLGNVSDAVKQSYITRLNNMEAEYQKAGASGSFNAGVEGGKLISEIASLAAGGAGVAKGGAVLVEKVAAKVVGKAESAVVNAGKATSGAENAATYPKLKDELVQQNLNNIASQDSRLAVAVKGDGTGKKDFSMGEGSRAEADRLGMIWLGDGAKQTSGGGWVSADGTRGYRSPSAKDSPFATTGTQANFETYEINSTGKAIKIGNGHLNILD